MEYVMQPTTKLADVLNLSTNQFEEIFKTNEDGSVEIIEKFDEAFGEGEVKGVANAWISFYTNLVERERESRSEFIYTFNDVGYRINKEALSNFGMLTLQATIISSTPLAASFEFNIIDAASIARTLNVAEMMQFGAGLQNYIANLFAKQSSLVSAFSTKLTENLSETEMGHFDLDLPFRQELLGIINSVKEDFDV